MQTSREIIDGLLRNKPMERIGLHDSPWGDTFTKWVKEAGKPDGVWLYEDLGFNKGLFCSPSILENLIFPYYKEMVDFFHGYDLPVVLHSCGGIKEALDLIVGAGFDALNPMEAKAGCDVVSWEEWTRVSLRPAIRTRSVMKLFTCAPRLRIWALVMFSARIIPSRQTCGWLIFNTLLMFTGNT